MARTPHGYHDTALIRDDLEKAGFSTVMTVVSRVPLVVAASVVPAAIGTVLVFFAHF
jgi:hypothetical protein